MGCLAGRLVLITGASRGLGAAVAVACAREGAKLILVARTRGGLEATDDAVRAAGGEEATLIPLDLTQGDVVDKLGAPLFERYGRLDGLVACAGELGILTPVAHLDPKQFAKTVALNLLANQRLIRTLDPLLRASDAGRAIFVTDAQAREHKAYWGCYAASKAALEALVLAWAAEARITKLTVNLFQAPPMRTRLRAQAFPDERAGVTHAPEEVAPAIIPLLTASETRRGELIEG
jgi:NAD(P)-dependent dehydrogenase (short-subunit alcohol dehydrogenase family)